MREIEPETRYRRRSLIGSRSTRSSSPELDSVNALVLRLKISTSKGFLRLYRIPDYQRGYNESLQWCLKSTKIRLYVQLDVSYLYRFTHLGGDFSAKVCEIDAKVEIPGCMYGAAVRTASEYVCHSPVVLPRWFPFPSYGGIGSREGAGAGGHRLLKSGLLLLLSSLRPLASSLSPFSTSVASPADEVHVKDLQAGAGILALDIDPVH